MLVKQKLTVPLTEGLNTKSDDRFLLPGEVSVLENGVYRKSGRLDKKFGFTNFTMNILGGGTLSSATGVYALGDELLCEANGTLYSYSSTSNAWVNKGTINRTSLLTSDIVRNNAEQTDHQFAVIGNIRVYSWKDTRGGVRYSVQDTVTGTYYVHDASLSSTGSFPRITTLGTTFTLYYRISGNIYYKTVSTSTPTTLSGETQITSITDMQDASGAAYFDVIAAGGDIYISYQSSTSKLETRKYAGGNLASLTLSDTRSPTDIDSYIKVIASEVSGAYRIHIAWCQSNDSKMHVRILDSSFNVILGDTPFSSTATTPKYITGVQVSSASHNIQWFYCNSYTTDSYNNQIEKGVMGTSGIVTDTAAAPKRSFRLSTEAFTLNGTVYVGIVNVQEPQVTLFIVDSSYNMIAKVAAAEATIGSTYQRLSSTIVANGDVDFAFGKKGEYRVDDNVGYTLIGYAFASLNFSPSTSASRTILNDVMYLAGGILKVYDGVSVFEDGFAYYPTIISATAGATTGEMSVGTFQYVATYEWLDNKGNLHQSAPSAVVEASITSQTSMDVFVDNLSLSEKSNNNRSNVKVVLWRTTGEGSIGSVFYRIIEQDNNPATPYQQFVDIYSDEALLNNPIIYTQGGVLENIQSPASEVVITHNKHLIVVGLEDGSTARVSKPARKNDAPGFNEALDLRMPSEGGEIVTAATMDDKILFFKANAIYYSVGDGPDDFGSNLYSQPQIVSDTIGCPYKNGVALTPAGLLFKSENGIYILTRGLSLEPVGQAVEDFDTSDVSDIVKIIGENEVRVCTTGGNMLVYNYDLNKWSVFPSKPAVGSTIWDNKQIIVSSAAQVAYEDSSTYLDNSTFVPLKVTTGWLSLDEIAGLQRVYKVQVIGDYHTPHKLTLDVSYDENPTVVETHQLELTADPKQYIYEARPRRQKFSSVQYTIRDAAPTSGTGTGQGFAISSLRLVVGLKSRLSNVPNIRRL